MHAPDRRQACIAALSCFAVMPARAAFGFDDLMATLAQRKSGEARFTEQRFVSVLDQPLNYTGTLSFTAPDRLVRTTLTPRRESFVVEGNQITLQRGDRVRQLPLDSVPELAAMVAALRGTLSGDGSALRRYFKPSVDGVAARWTLTLVPLDFRLLGVVRQLRIDGMHADVRAGRAAVGRRRPLGDHDRPDRADRVSRHHTVTRAPLPRRGWIAVVVWLAALAIGVWVIAHTRISADLSAFLPAAPDARQRALVEQLKSGVAARTLLIGIDGAEATQRAAASRALAERLRADPAFEHVLNGDFTAFAAIGRWVFEHRYLISPAIDARRFSVEGLREAIDDTLSLLGTPAGAAIKPLLDRDPTGETQRIAEGAVTGGGPRVQDGIWVSRDGRRALLMTQSRAEGSDLDAQAHALTVIHDAFAASAAPGLDLRLSGAPKFAVDSRAQIEAETKALAITGSVLMGGLLLIAFASLPALAAAMLPVATGIVAGVAAVSLLFGGVHGATLGFGTTLIGEAVDYAIYYLIQARGSAALTAGGDAPTAGWRRWVQDGWPTVRLGLLTSICGFLALAFSGFPGLAQLGVFSIAGLVAAALTTRHVLPVWLPDGARGLGLRRQLGRGAAALVRTAPRARHLLTVLGALALLLLLWRHETLWQTELSSLSPVSAEALALDTQLRDELLAGDERTMVAVTAADAQTVLQTVEAVSLRLDALVQTGQLVGYDSDHPLGAQPRDPAAPPRRAARRRHVAEQPGTGHRRRLVECQAPGARSCKTCSARAKRRPSRRPRWRAPRWPPSQRPCWCAVRMAAAPRCCRWCARRAPPAQVRRRRSSRRCAASMRRKCSTSATSCAACTGTTSVRRRARRCSARSAWCC